MCQRADVPGRNQPPLIEYDGDRQAGYSEVIQQFTVDVYELWVGNPHVP
jgi:hypothetical protein